MASRLYDQLALRLSQLVLGHCRAAKHMKGEKHVFEKVDWSTTGPWHQNRRLFGLNEFASFITTLSMQKTGTEFRNMILPHHVFQLQCIVDSLAASRGWTVSPLHGHVLTAPAAKFVPWRDVDLFLDREIDRETRGILQAIEVLNQLLQKDAGVNRDPDRHAAHSQILDNLKFDFVNWLGESKCKYGLTTIPPSRFSKHNANGLWEYSPLLCGAGLAEGLVLAQRVVMDLWDRIPEPTLIMHLHNMLVKKGYLEREVGMWGTLEGLLQDAFFPNGVPTSGFHKALRDRVGQRNDRTTLRQRQAVIRDKTTDIHKILTASFNNFFKTKSVLIMYYDAQWIPDRIPDSDVPIPSLLYVLRLSDTGRDTDPTTKEQHLRETNLVKRAKAQGWTDKELLQLASVPLSEPGDGGDATEVLRRHITDLKDYKSGPSRNPYRISEEKEASQLQGRALLEFLRADIFADVCGSNPLSSLNLVMVTAHMMVLFMLFEDRFEEARHPLWVDAYERPSPQLRRQKRLAFVASATAAEDDEALKLFAGAFEEMRLGALSCVFWEDLRAEESGVKASKSAEGFPMDQCTVM